MDEKILNDALDAIHDEVLKLILQADSKEMLDGLQLIHAIARHKYDIRPSGNRDKLVHKMFVDPNGVILGQQLKAEDAPTLPDGQVFAIFVKADSGLSYVGSNVNDFPAQDQKVLPNETF